MVYSRKAIGYYEACKIRRFETRDIAKRIGVLSPSNVVFSNYPIKNPIALFNASATLNSAGEVEIYPRIILGYYLYVSAIGVVKIPIQDILNREFERKTHEARIVVFPSNKYDFWGCEDPRVYRIDGKLHMTYTGRTINYFRKPGSHDGALPVTAVFNQDGGYWEKKFVHVQVDELRLNTVLDKDAFLYKVNGVLKLFHRPVLKGDKYHLCISDPVIPEKNSSYLVESLSLNTLEVMPPANFEEKLGWACPVESRGNKLIALVHGVDSELSVYRVLAVELSIERDEVVLDAVTPYYIMEPRTLYEIYGDRPYVVFPTGAVIVDDQVLVTYGGADSVVGLATIDVSELYSALDHGRING